ncbi:hypothetical protein CRYUN_Cryun32bG0019200 [Craigia yunnanensis]
MPFLDMCQKILTLLLNSRNNGLCFVCLQQKREVPQNHSLLYLFYFMEIVNGCVMFMMLNNLSLFG